MSYQPTVWKDRVVEKPRTFDVTNNPDGSITLVPKPGVVVQEGTPASAALMNKIEQGIAEHQADSMPHRFTDGGKIYRWGFRTVNGQPQFIYEEVAN